MEKLKMYVNRNELNEYEMENNKISFKKLINRLFDSMIMCNDITKLFYKQIDGEFLEPELFIGYDYDEDADEYTEIYQYFIVDFNSYTYNILEKFKKELNNEFVLYYVDYLGIYVLGVTHWGTGWDYVLTDIEPTNDIDESDI